jgi:hypothetical protein
MRVVARQQLLVQVSTKHCCQQDSKQRTPCLHLCLCFSYRLLINIISTLLCAGWLQDLHTPQIMSALQSLSSMVLQLHPLQGLQQELVSKATGRSCHGQLTASSKRARVGRLKVEQQLYALLPDGDVEVFAAPEGAAVDARLLVETSLVQQQLQQKQQQQQQQQKQQPGGGSAQAAAPAAAAAAAAAGAGDELSQKISSSMRLEVSEQVGQSIATAAAGACSYLAIPVQWPQPVCMSRQLEHWQDALQQSLALLAVNSGCQRGRANGAQLASFSQSVWLHTCPGGTVLFIYCSLFACRSVWPGLLCSCRTCTRVPAGRTQQKMRGSTCRLLLVATGLAWTMGQAVAGLGTSCMCVIVRKSMIRMKTQMMTWIYKLRSSPG